LRARLRDLSDCRRFEDAARLRDRIAALEGLVRFLDRLERLRRMDCCVLVPAVEPGFVRALFVTGGRVAGVRTLPPGGGARLEVQGGLAALETAAAEDVDALLLIGTFLRRPPPELRVAPLELEAILRLAAALPRALAGEAPAPARARAA
jgi:excinuclease UvrABC nuclease subunit